jgi:hypothetical protein
MTTPAQTRIAKLQQLIAGLPKVAPAMVIPYGTQNYDTTQLAAVMQAFVDAATAVASARAALKAAIQAQRDLQAQSGAMVSHVKQVLRMLLSGAEPALVTLGLTPVKAPRALTAEAKVARAAKAKATREARGTKSKKQKAAIHGSVVGVTITPILATGTSGEGTGTGSSAGSSAGPHAEVGVSAAEHGAGVAVDGGG